MRVVAEARTIRSNARDRSVLTLIAQEELDRLRALPAASLIEGSTINTLPNWPSGTVSLATVSRGPLQSWQLDVEITRESTEGKPAVRLTTLRQGKAIQ